MEELINKLINMGMEQFMDHSRQDLVLTDEIYLQDLEDEAELERRYMRMRLSLSNEQRDLIEDYMACTETAASRYSDISYMAGIKDAVRMFVYLELLKGY